MSLLEIQVKTRTGATINVLDPQPGDIHLEDIARGLSKLCRFNGQSNDFYSVAEHSVLVARLIGESTEAPVHSQTYRWALLHDAAEAYIGDMISPVKHHPALGAFVAIESRLISAIARRFNLRLPVPDEVNWADEDLRRFEFEQLMTTEPAPRKRAADDRIQCYDHDMAYGLFWETAKRAGL